MRGIVAAEKERLRVFEDAASMHRFAADLFTDLARKAVAERGLFVVSLAGGRTPEPLYRLLSKPPYSRSIDWSKVHLFFGDERCVPPDHRRSNYRMVRKALISSIDIPQDNIHRMKAELPPAQAALEYERGIKSFFSERGLEHKNGVPVFDLFLLGLGPDGHTLSLFPGTKALEERERLVVENRVDGEWRLTMTYTLACAARHLVFLVAGSEKAEALRRLLSGRHNVADLPAAGIRPVDGELLYLADREAAGLIV